MQREMVYDGRQPIKMTKSMTPDLASRSLSARLLKHLAVVVVHVCSRLPAPLVGVRSTFASKRRASSSYPASLRIHVAC